MKIILLFGIMTLVFGLLIIYFATKEKKSTFRLVVCCFLFTCTIAAYAKYVTTREEIKITVNVEEFTVKSGVLYLNNEEVYISHKIPPLFIIRCKEELVIRRRSDMYYLEINDNL